MNIYYVYYLIDSRNSQPFYVGKGCGNRMYQHVYEARSGHHTNKLKCHRILSILKNGGDVLYQKVKENLIEDKAFNIESQLIRKHGCLMDNTGILTNIKKEDFVNINSKRPVDQYSLNGEFLKSFESITAAAINIDVTPNMIGNVCSGRGETSGGFRWMYSGDRLGKFTSHDDRQCSKYKPVLQLNNYGTILNEFATAKHAETHTGISSSNISACCCESRRKSAGGFKWKFVNH